MKTQKLLEKAEQIDSYISRGKATPSQMRLKLTELATFRNTLFHDLSYVKRPTYSHTVFALKAEKMNQVDLMQAIIVAVNTFVIIAALSMILTSCQRFSSTHSLMLSIFYRKKYCFQHSLRFWQVDRCPLI